MTTTSASNQGPDAPRGTGAKPPRRPRPLVFRIYEPEIQLAFHLRKLEMIEVTQEALRDDAVWASVLLPEALGSKKGTRAYLKLGRPAQLDWGALTPNVQRSRLKKAHTNWLVRIDRQLDTIKELCEETGLEVPEHVASHARYGLSDRRRAILHHQECHELFGSRQPHLGLIKRGIIPPKGLGPRS